MARTKNVNGVEFERVEFIPLKEPFCEYLIEQEGVKVRVKLVLLDMYLAKGKLNATGDPLLQFTSQTVATAEKLDESDRPPAVSP